MNPFTETQTKLTYVQRINQLRATSSAKWGKMSVDQMLKHLIDLFQLANATRTTKMSWLLTIVSSLIGPIIKNRLINNDRPLPKNLGNAPLPVSQGFEVEKQTLLASIDQFDQRKTSTKPVPLFGKLSPQEWETFLTKQLDHHLIQFGV